MALCARPVGRCIALRTCDGSSDPDEHADPVETATPSRSSAMSSDSASTPVKLIFVVFGTRATAAAVDDRAVDRAQDAALQPVAQRLEPRRLVAQMSERQPRRDAEADDRGDVLGAGAPVALVASAGEDGREPHAAADPERADTLGAVELVGRQRQQVHAERAHVYRHLADGLHGVGVEQGAVASSDRGQVGDRLDGADLVVGVHDGDDGGLRRENAFERGGGDDAVGGHRHGGPFVTAAREMPAGVEDGFVLDRAGDKALAAAQPRALRRRRGGRSCPLRCRRR